MMRRLWILTAISIVAAVCLQASTRQERVPPLRPLAQIPWNVGEWKAVSQQDFDPATVAVLRADDYVSRNYVRQSQDEADLYVGYYVTQRQGDTIHSPMNCLPAAGWQLLSLGRTTIQTEPERSITINRHTIQNGLDKRMVLYWYQSHGRAVASEYWSRAYLVLDSLQLHRSDGALIRVITPIHENELQAERAGVDFVRALFPILDRHLPG